MKGDTKMSLIKNLRRREVEVFGAKKVVRNEIKKEEKALEKEEPKAKTKKKNNKNKED